MRSVSSPRAVNMITGTDCLRRRSRSTSKPLRDGSITSRMTRSKLSSAIRFKASAPSTAVTMRNDSAARYSLNIWLSSKSSSTSKTEFSAFLQVRRSKFDEQSKLPFRSSHRQRGYRGFPKISDNRAPSGKAMVAPAQRGCLNAINAPQLHKSSLLAVLLSTILQPSIWDVAPDEQVPVVAASVLCVVC